MNRPSVFDLIRISRSSIKHDDDANLCICDECLDPLSNILNPLCNKCGSIIDKESGNACSACGNDPFWGTLHWGPFEIPFLDEKVLSDIIVSPEDQLGKEKPS